MVHWPTWDFGLKGAAYDVLGSSILDGDQVVSRSHGHVGNFVALGTILAVHLYLGRPVDGHRQSSWSGITRVHDKLWGHAWQREHGDINIYLIYHWLLSNKGHLFVCIPVVPPSSPGPKADTMPGSPTCPGSPTRILKGLPGTWLPLKRTSIEWTPFSFGMNLIACWSVGRHGGQVTLIIILYNDSNLSSWFSWSKVVSPVDNQSRKEVFDHQNQ